MKLSNTGTDDAPKKPVKRATVVDVARLAGVSPGTVSNATNGKRHVDSETRARIEAAIKTLGYVPNMAARVMRTGRANTIALLSSMPTAVAAGPSKLGFMMELAASAALTALTRDVALVLVPPIASPSDVLRNVPLDGALLVEPAEDDPFLDMLAARSIPCVGIGRPPLDEIPFVDLHYEETARLLTAHLMAAGARSFPLMIGKSRRRAYSDFERVYRAELERAGLAPRVLSVDETRGEIAAAQAIRAEIEANPALDGVLVPVDALASGVMSGLREIGRPVPQEVKVVTRYDGIRARTETPPLTAVDLHLDQVAEIATQALLDIVEGTQAGDIPAPRLPELVVRASTAGP